MVRTVGFEHRFPVPWEHTTTALWCKYPSPELAHVRDALVLQRWIDKNGVLHSVRLMCIEQPLPALLKRFAGGLTAYYALEKSTVDPVKKELRMETRNLTFESMLVADEVCTYRADGAETVYTWEVTCEGKQHIPLVTGKVEEALVDKAKGNSSAGLSKMEDLALEVSRKWVEKKTQKFNRWPTRFPSRNHTQAAQVESQPISRRFWVFGPRKPLSESSWLRSNDDSC